MPHESAYTEEQMVTERSDAFADGDECLRRNASDAPRLENGKLKKRLADRMPENEILKKINAGKRERARAPPARPSCANARNLALTCVRAAPRYGPASLRGNFRYL